MSDTTASSSNIARLARQSCFACRAKKRKCTRELPACTLCRRNHRPCEYADSPGADSSPLYADESAHSSIAPSEPGKPFRNASMNLFFLDSYMFKQRKETITMRHMGLPKEYLSLVENEIQVQQALESYFNDFHPYFPCISKRRFISSVSSGSIADQPDLAFLLVTMQMLVSGWNSTEFLPCPQHDLYLLSKRLYLYLETTGVVSLKVAQGLLLIAIYELGNAIFPAAYMTIGNCSRLSQALGIHERRGVTRMLAPTWLWTEVEECRRVWWACIILERYVNIGLEGRHFACPDAKPDDLLPMDEQRWESGEPSVSPSLAVSASPTLFAPPFARTCQATHLLSRVLQHLSITSRPPSVDDWYREAIQLHHIISAFSLALEHEFTALHEGTSTSALALFPAIGLCYSASLTLYSQHSCADGEGWRGEGGASDSGGGGGGRGGDSSSGNSYNNNSGVGIPEQLEMQGIALEGLLRVCGQVAALARQVSEVLGDSGRLPTTAAVMSPLVASCLYDAAFNYLWYYRESGRPDLVEPIREITGALKMVAAVWKVGDEYLSILEGPEFQAQGGHTFSLF